MRRTRPTAECIASTTLEGSTTSPVAFEVAPAEFSRRATGHSGRIGRGRMSLIPSKRPTLQRLTEQTPQSCKHLRKAAAGGSYPPTRSAPRRYDSSVCRSFVAAAHAKNTAPNPMAPMASYASCTDAATASARQDTADTAKIRDARRETARPRRDLAFLPGESMAPTRKGASRRRTAPKPLTKSTAPHGTDGRLGPTHDFRMPQEQSAGRSDFPMPAGPVPERDRSRLRPNRGPERDPSRLGTAGPARNCR